MIPNFQLAASGLATNAFTSLNITDFHAACFHVQNLKYGRILNPSDFTLVLRENQGTCSSKHGLLALLAEENVQNDMHLMVGIFLMSAETHPVVGPILAQNSLKSIPEAHAYFRYDGKRYDFTAKGKSIETIEPFIVREQRCDPNQMIEWKPMIHKHYLEGWLKRQNLSFTIEEIWKIREACISVL